MLVLACAAAVMVGTAGCGGGGKSVSAQDIVAQAAEKTAQLKSFHFVFSAANVPAGKTGLSLNYADGDLVVPDRLRCEVGGTFMGVPLRSALIVIGQAYYLKDPFSGKWQKVTAKTNPVSFFDPAKGVLAIVKGATSLTRAGSEKISGVETYRVTGKVRDDRLTSMLGNHPSGRLVDVELWIGTGDSLLRRLRLAGPVSTGEPANAVRTVDLSGFDKLPRIQPPAVSG